MLILLTADRRPQLAQFRSGRDVAGTTLLVDAGCTVSRRGSAGGSSAAQPDSENDRRELVRVSDHQLMPGFYDGDLLHAAQAGDEFTLGARR